MDDPRRYAPAAARNRDAILDVLRRAFPRSGLVLEIASGSGEHAAHMAPALAATGGGEAWSGQWQPTDLDPAALAGIDAHARDADPEGRLILPALRLDTTADPWPVETASAILCVNMIHIAPWAACLGLMRGAGHVLRDGGVLCLYGPYKRGGRHTAPSNEAFDASLRARDPSWGVRDLDDVAAAAADHGMTLADIVEMPANNLSLIFRRG